MNLYFLVEGDRTEKFVYRRWIEYCFPFLSPAPRSEDMVSDSYLIISGGGIPSYMSRLRDVLRAIKDNPAIDHLFVCIDAEDLGYAARFNEVLAEVRAAEAETQVRQMNPSFHVHIIIQECCMETWFLGHTKMMRKTPSSPVLAAYRRFYDVRGNDPEGMGAPPGHGSKAAFHMKYLQEMLLEQNPELRYSKARPGKVLDRDYLDALRERIAAAGHLASLQKLFAAWNALTPAPR